AISTLLAVIAGFPRQTRSRSPVSACAENEGAAARIGERGSALVTPRSSSRGIVLLRSLQATQGLAGASRPTSARSPSPLAPVAGVSPVTGLALLAGVFLLTETT